MRLLLPLGFFVITLVVGFLLPLSYAGAAPIYVFEEKSGVIRFSSKTPPAGVKAEVFTGRGSRFSYYRGRAGRSGSLFTDRYNPIIEAAARRHRVSPSLIRAVIHVESAFNPKAVSPKGALGLMQLIPPNLETLRVRDPFCPQENIFAGVDWLSRLSRRYSGNLQLTLAAYNAGIGAVERYGGIPPFTETRNYVQRVIELQRRYQQAGI